MEARENLNQAIKVGISDYKTSKSPDTLVTYALGSCVGISLYDPLSGVGGLSHIMLPTSALWKNGEVDDRMKYADTAIEDMVLEMIGQGAIRYSIEAKIAGGAKMNNLQATSFMDAIGDRNIEAVKRELLRLSIPIVAEDVGENYGRTIYFSLKSGKVKVFSLGKNVKEM
jgi:chemotaxis protein CheD